MDCAPKVCIAVINREKFSWARACVRTAAHLGLIRSRRRAEKKLTLDWKMATLNFGFSFGMCTLRHARALWEVQIRKPKLKKRTLCRGFHNITTQTCGNPSQMILTLKKEDGSPFLQDHFPENHVFEIVQNKCETWFFQSLRSYSKIYTTAMSYVNVYPWLMLLRRMNPDHLWWFNHSTLQSAPLIGGKSW